ncbi:uncharacterized protein QC763_0110650 [Podospora pseudopauciseta]|uniref:NADH dehydrogenase [ubiquinone] 1 alpha subcomplex assembly factor 3 n=2 Tax=Podospora TaxID=5144 RepID=A0ABR0H2D9_9PEZI|nr:hypothetical protein QC763_0110650 [Podospora pseudopauciseta]KAK4668867.1 hypothetical protein QC764_0106670 [Podospora pseudoanserina]
MATFSPSIPLSAPARRLTTLRRITTSRPSLLSSFTTTPRISAACFFSSPSRTLSKGGAPLAHNNEPVPTSSPTTDFSSLDVLGNTPVPSTSIDVCHHDGFSLNSGVQITNGSGALLIGGEAFEWKPWLTKDEKGTRKKMINSKWQWEIDPESLGVLSVVWPRPDLLILGVGKYNRPISPKTRQAIGEMGMRVEVLDTRNAASQYNLLATERGVGDVAAALVPIGFEE